MQHLTITGNVARDAEKLTVRDKDYTKVLVACQEQKDGPTTWYEVILRVWTDGLARTLRKGAGLAAEGRPAYSAYTNKAGEAHYDLTLWANDFQITRFAKDEEAAPAELTPERAKAKAHLVEAEKQEDDLPF